MKTKQMIQTVKPMDEAEVCERCGNIYIVNHLKEGDDWNDFGFRYCPFCGLLIDEYANIK